MTINRPKGKKRGAAGPQPADAPSSSTLNNTHTMLPKPLAMSLEGHASSPMPSTYPTEDEDDTATKKERGFRFLDLPSELRTKIYSLAFHDTPDVLDLDPHTFQILARKKILSLFRVSKQIYHESTYHFFSTHTFRIFPTYPGRYFKTKKPILARIPAQYRASITSLELRLGPGWNNPPRGWVVNDALGLADCKNVRVLKVFVECDPSDAIFNGFRMGDGFYERFSADLLTAVLDRVQSVRVVEFDAFPGVKRTGDMVVGLGQVVNTFEKAVGWGPEKGWSVEVDQTWLDAILIHGAGKLHKSAVVFAGSPVDMPLPGNTKPLSTLLHLPYR